MNYYPAFLNLDGKPVLLFGGGQVALRKAKVLMQAGAVLAVVSREFSSPFLKWAKRHRVKLVRGTQVPKLTNAWLVVAATSDSEFNRRIFQACEKNKIFVNVVDDPKNCNFIVPSVVRRGLLQIAISTGGASPFLAKTIRKKLEKQFGSEYAHLLKKLAEDRTRVKRNMTAKERRNYFKKQVASQLKILSR